MGQHTASYRTASRVSTCTGACATRDRSPSGNATSALVVATGLAIALVFYPITQTVIENCARRALRARHVDLPGAVRVSPRALWGMVLTQGVYLAATIGAIFCKAITWRGIRYRIAGPQDITMEEYRPMSESEDGNHSSSIEG